MNKFTTYALIASVVVLVFGSGYRLGQKDGKQNAGQPSMLFKNTQTASQKPIDFSLFWDVWAELDKNFVDEKKLDKQKMFFGAIKGMVSSLEDPYTFFLTPSENKQSKDDLGGKFEGIGAQLGQKDSQIVVIAPLKNSPAEKAGMKSGDIIVGVNDKSTANWTVLQAVSAIRGDKGTTVKIKVIRGGKELLFTIKRDQIIVESVELVYEKEIAHITLTRFGDDTSKVWNQKVDDVVSKWKSGHIKGLVLDMRDNPGGYLQGAVYIASEFLPEGQLVVKQEYSSKPAEKYLSDAHGRLRDIPMVILINKGSASAAEIVAGALRDYKRAKLLGEKSFGKGSIQEAMDLREGAGLHVTVAKWILPKGSWINGKGVTPDIEVKNEVKEGNTLTREADKQLDKALELLIK